METSERDQREAVYGAETERMLEILRALVHDKGISIRQLEKRSGVADALFNKILKGKVTLQFRHILMLADALGVAWQDLFGHAYGFKSAFTQPISPEFRSKVLMILLELGLVNQEVLSKPAEIKVERGATSRDSAD